MVKKYQITAENPRALILARGTRLISEIGNYYRKAADEAEICYICRPNYPERCQSGRTSKPGKFVYSQGYRGFESRPLRFY
jgi:hypothetical protein